MDLLEPNLIYIQLWNQLGHKVGMLPYKILWTRSNIWCRFFHSRNSRDLGSRGGNGSEPSHHYLMGYISIFENLVWRFRVLCCQGAMLHQGMQRCFHDVRAETWLFGTSLYHWTNWQKDKRGLLSCLENTSWFLRGYWVGTIQWRQERTRFGTQGIWWALLCTSMSKIKPSGKLHLPI